MLDNLLPPLGEQSQWESFKDTHGKLVGLLSVATCLLFYGKAALFN